MILRELLWQTRHCLSLKPIRRNDAVAYLRPGVEVISPRDPRSAVHAMQHAGSHFTWLQIRNN